MTTQITWTPNPLRCVIEPDDEAKRTMRIFVENELLHGLIGKARYLLTEPSTALEAVEFVEEEAKRRLARYLDALTSPHDGDCICNPATCLKCQAEEALGIKTLAGLSKHVAHKIAYAFRKDGAPAEGERSLAEAIDRLANYDPPPWPGHLDLFRECLPRWKAEAKEAHAWLVQYRDQHFQESRLDQPAYTDAIVCFKEPYLKQPTYTDAVVFVRSLRAEMEANRGADLSHEELTMVFMVLDSLIEE